MEKYHLRQDTAQTVGLFSASNGETIKATADGTSTSMGMYTNGSLDYTNSQWEHHILQDDYSSLVIGVYNLMGHLSVIQVLTAFGYTANNTLCNWKWNATGQEKSEL